MNRVGVSVLFSLETWLETVVDDKCGLVNIEVGRLVLAAQMLRVRWQGLVAFTFLRHFLVLEKKFLFQIIVILSVLLHALLEARILKERLLLQLLHLLLKLYRVVALDHLCHLLVLHLDPLLRF